MDRWVVKLPLTGVNIPLKNQSGAGNPPAFLSLNNSLENISSIAKNQ